MQKIKTQILIIGGGIAGLWLLSKLKEQGYDALLCEKTALGNGQTIASQGIIHGGLKYSLTGKLTTSTIKIGDMPKIWEHSLNGKNTPNLKRAKILSPHQYLWTTHFISSELTAFFASKLVKGKMEKLSKNNYPPVFKNEKFNNSVYQLNEKILDVPSVLNIFQNELKEQLIHIEDVFLQKTAADNYEVKMTTIEGEIYLVEAAHIICLAGEGNEKLVQPVGFKLPVMQRRPLQMLMMRGQLPFIYGHALGFDNLPQITITSHVDNMGRTVWYMGGKPAEKGVGMPPKELIKQTKKELNKLIKWTGFSKTKWATWNIDRAEGFQKNGSRPDTPILKTKSNVCAAWPTKLAFAPLLSDLIMDWIKKENTQPEKQNTPFEFPTPPTATPIWDRKEITWI